MTGHVFNTVTCDSVDETGCGMVWLEMDGWSREVCPRCGRTACNGNVVVNGEDAPDVTRLKDSDVLVVFEECEA